LAISLPQKLFKTAENYIDHSPQTQLKPNKSKEFNHRMSKVEDEHREKQKLNFMVSISLGSLTQCDFLFAAK
jgi:hypothetical protein